MSQFPLFFSLGIIVGTLGTLIGAGGGFLLVPTLLFLRPDQTPKQTTAISLFVVACNALSGSVAYLARRQVHLKSALLFATFTIPGALAGSHLVRFISQTQFELLFSALMFGLGVFLLLRKPSNTGTNNDSHRVSQRTYILGSLVSFGVSFMATLLGIGGGIVHVPLMNELGYPVHMATGTSHLILAVGATIASVQHWIDGTLNFADPILLPLAAGAILGAQLGAGISKKVHGQTILRLLGVALLIVAVRLAWRNF